jgi:Domain of unknown function (DUF1992)
MARKPLASSFESFVEQQIREAQERGAFDNLPGAGKPLPDLDEPHDPMWWVKRKLRDEQLSLLPDALQIRVDLERALEARTESELREALLDLNQRIARLNSRVTEGPPTSLALVDAEAIVRRWRESS